MLQWGESNVWICEFMYRHVATKLGYIPFGSSKVISVK